MTIRHSFLPMGQGKGNIFDCRRKHNLKKMEKVKTAWLWRKSQHEGVARERLPATPSARTGTDLIPKETMQRFPQLFWSGSRYILCCPNNNCIRTTYKSFACLLYYCSLPNTHLRAEVLLSHCLSYTAASVQSPSRSAQLMIYACRDS